MHDLESYKTLIRSFPDRDDEHDSERLKVILRNKTRLEFLKEYEISMHNEICEWERWHIELKNLIYKEERG